MPPSRTVYVAKRSKRVHPSVLHRYIFTTGYRRLEHAGCRHQWRWQDRSDIQISEHQYVADVPVQWGRDLQASVLHRHLLAARYRRLEHAGCRHQWRWQDRSDIQISEHQYVCLLKKKEADDDKKCVVFGGFFFFFFIAYVVIRYSCPSRGLGLLFKCQGTCRLPTSMAMARPI